MCHIFCNQRESYLFDDKTGVVLQIPTSDRVHVTNLFKESKNPIDFVELVNKKMQDVNNPSFLEILKDLCVNFRAFFREADLEIPSPSEKDVYNSIIRNGLFEMILEVTNACNLRCRYCVFSGIYEGFRTNQNKYMSPRVARKAVDMYFRYLHEGSLENWLREPTVGFYGGEPLLNFNLIKIVVNYIKENYIKESKCNFTITTNGVLLNEEIIDFLLVNNFSIYVSLDGPKEIHDQNRVFPDGSGTFDIVIKNMEKINKRAKKLNIKEPHAYAVAVYDLETDLKKVKEFFEDAPLPLMFYNPVRPLGTDYYAKFSDKDLTRFYRTIGELEKEFLAYIGSKRYKHKPNSFLDCFFGFNAILYYFRFLIARDTSPYIPLTQSCFPGFKIYVDAEGVLHPCERGPTSLVTGNVNDGLDFKLIAEMIRKYQEIILRKKCSRCPSAKSCVYCLANLGLETPDDETCDTAKLFLSKGLNLAMQARKINPEYFKEMAQRYKDVQLEYR